MKTVEILDAAHCDRQFLGRCVASFVVGFAADLGRRLIEPAAGPLGIFFLPVWALLYSFAFVTLAVLAGLLLRLPPLAQLWARSFAVAAFLASLGMACFGYGIGRAHLAYFSEHLGGEAADRWIATWATPGYFILVFSVANWPRRARPAHERKPSQPPALA